MKTAGLLGGMSWESTLQYYRLINEGVNQALGELHSAELILYSVNFDPIEKLQHKGHWEKTAGILAEAARKTESAGADFLLICSNTMHKVAPQIEREITIPLLHIADVTAEELVQKGINNVGLLGTAFTMEQDFYKGRLYEKYGLSVLVPGNENRQRIHNIIFQELCKGKITFEAKDVFLDNINYLASQGAESVILGCTEIRMLINQSDTDVLLIDTTAIHVEKAVKECIS